MRGVYLVAAELARRGYVASPLSRSSRGADILVSSSDYKRTFAVEVKAITNKNFFQLAKHAQSIHAKSLIYVFVRIKPAKDRSTRRPAKPEEVSYYPVPSRFVSENVHSPGVYRNGWSIWLDKIKKFRDKWEVFGPPNGD